MRFSEPTEEHRLEESVPAPSTFRPGTWDISFVLVVPCVFFLLLMLVGWLTYGGEAPVETEDWKVFLVHLPAQLLSAVFAIVFVGLMDPRGKAALGLASPKVRGVARGLLRYLLAIGPIWWAAVLVYQWLGEDVLRIEFPDQEAQQLVVDVFGDPLTGTWILVLIVLVVVIAGPLFEEVFFRGILHGWIRNYLGPRTSAVIVGALFGLFHLEWQTMLPLALLGYMLSRLREGPGGLWACIAAHGLHNAIVLAFALTDLIG